MELDLGHNLITLTYINGHTYTLFGFMIENDKPKLHFVSEFSKNGKTSKLYKEREIYHSAYRDELKPNIPVEIQVQIDALFKGCVLNAL